MEMKMIDAASGGVLVNMTPQRARELISTMATNSQQFQPVTEPTRQVHGLSSLSLKDKIDKLANIVQTLLLDKTGPIQLCRICAKPDHPTNSCPILQEDLIEQANTVGNFPRPPQRWYDPYSNSYNVGWKDHPNLSYGTNLWFNQPFQQRPPQNQQIPTPKSSLEAIVERLANSTKKFQQKTAMHLQELDKQVSKLALTVSRLESQGKLPSQIEPNPRHNVSAIMLRSEKILEPVPGTSRAHDAGLDEKKLDTEAPVESAPQKSFAVPPPFPRRLAQCKKERDEKEILDTFRKVKINIPLLNTIKQIPRYAKFLKDLCTSKRKLLGNEKVSVGENVSAVLQRKIPPKCKDQGMFFISCKIGSVSIKKAMCDLGASINVMPLSIYKLLNAGPLKETGVIIQLADRSVVHPKGVLEDVLVKVNELIFPADFYIIDMEDGNSANSSEILLGRPFLSTSQTRIDVWSGTLTMEFDNEMVKFNVYEDMGHPNDKSQIVPCRNVDLDVKQEELSMIQKPICEAVMKASKLELKLFLERTRIPIENNANLNGEAQRHLNPLMIGESRKGFKDNGQRLKLFCKNIQVHEMEKLSLNEPNG
ncbi:uncharacterized protein LOC108473495 [Gossypium arboreum]|uniref:uncharacterized protein LOC108473495 n=1 Tax=Gossypium arboreum TaxID=29729 RepID=UPI00081975F5|nr:uncharacterized protein LOC108473495 [Gossypium arboreum]